MNVIDIVERFQIHHALQEEREFKNSHAWRNGTSAKSAATKNRIGKNIIFEGEEVRIMTVTLPRDTEWSPPYDGRDRLVARLGQIDHPFAKDGDPAISARWIWVPPNGDFKVANQTDETRHLMIVAFHDLDHEQPSLLPLTESTATLTTRESSKSGLPVFGDKIRD
jgi:hypothetical protein